MNVLIVAFFANCDTTALGLYNVGHGYLIQIPSTDEMYKHTRFALVIGRQTSRRRAIITESEVKEILGDVYESTDAIVTICGEDFNRVDFIDPAPYSAMLDRHEEEDQGDVMSTIMNGALDIVDRFPPIYTGPL